VVAGSVGTLPAAPSHALARAAIERAQQRDLGGALEALLCPTHASSCDTQEHKDTGVL